MRDMGGLAKLAEEAGVLGFVVDGGGEWAGAVGAVVDSAGEDVEVDGVGAAQKKPPDLMLRCRSLRSTCCRLMLVRKLLM